MFIMRFAAGLVLLSAASAQNATEIEKGKQLFLGMCSRCHGVSGGGGEGPNLNRPALTRATNDQTLRAIIRDGIPDRGMPRVRRLTDAELSELVAFTRSLGRTGGVARTGTAAKGRAVYQRLGCASCHVVAGDGGSFGPELTSIGSHRAPDYLRQAIIEPAAALPRGVTPIPGRGFYEYLPVRLVTNDGREVNGVRVNEDTFTIQVKDAGSQLYSFRKTDLRQLDKEIGKSAMPDYKSRVAGGDLDDLVAYLSGLGGAK